MSAGSSHPIPFRQFFPGVLWAGLIYFLITLPQSDVPDLQGWGAWLEQIHFDKMVHAGLFGIQALLFLIPFRKSDRPASEKSKAYVWVCAGVILWGLATEFIQLTVPGRSFDWADWAADTLGVLLTGAWISRKN